MSRDAPPLDNTIEILTPENIAFRYRIAGPFRRFPAFLIDLLLRVLVVGGTMFVLGFLGTWLEWFLDEGAGSALAALALLLWFAMEWFYGGFFETVWNGQTPGKWVVGIRVLTYDGQPITPLQALLRNILRVADWMPLLSLQMFQSWFDEFGADAPPMYVIPTCLCAIFSMALTRRWQRIGDLACGTMVVIEERSWLAGTAPLDDPRTAALAALLPGKFEATRGLARALATYVERRRFFSPARRREIAQPLAEPLLAKFGLPADTSYDLLLCALYYRTFVTDRGEEEVAAPPQVRPPVAPATFEPPAPPVPLVSR